MPATDEHPSNPSFPLNESSPTFQMARKQLESVADMVNVERGILERLASTQSCGGNG